jgi:fermentation-respiration switch protein FrsA (DUF1100 family)
MTVDTTYVLYEDRPSAWVGLKLAVLSLSDQVPGARIVARAPHASPELRAWFAQRPGVTLDDTELAGARGWDVKPRVLLEALRSSTSAAWLDTDVIVAGDLEGLLAGVPAQTLVATEETHWGRAQGGVHRTVAWGLAPGRPLPVTINTGFLRVHASHTPLLEAWRDLLADPRYVAAQAKPYAQRPRHLFGDQDVLTALMASAEFSDLDLRLLAQGTEIAQCFGASGYTAAQRLKAVVTRAGLPVLIHAMNVKPWTPHPRSGSPLQRIRSTYRRLHGRLTPYTAVASRYAEALDEPAPWLGKPRSAPVAILQELPLATVEQITKLTRRRLGFVRSVPEA